VAREGQYTVTAGKAFRARKRACTLIVLWVPGQDHPWVVLTDEAPDDVDLGAYGLRVWIEQGFRTLKRMGWQWHRTRRLDPARVDRHWLVLAVATLWILAYGTRVEEARLRGLAPGRVRRPPPEPAAPDHRPLSVFQLGWYQAQRLLHRGHAWARVQRGPCRDRIRPTGCSRWTRPPGSSFLAQRCGLGLYLPLSAWKGWFRVSSQAFRGWLEYSTSQGLYSKSKSNCPKATRLWEYSSIGDDRVVFQCTQEIAMSHESTTGTLSSKSSGLVPIRTANRLAPATVGMSVCVGPA